MEDWDTKIQMEAFFWELIVPRLYQLHHEYLGFLSNARRWGNFGHFFRHVHTRSQLQRHLEHQPSDDQNQCYRDFFHSQYQWSVAPCSSACSQMGQEHRLDELSRHLDLSRSTVELSDARLPLRGHRGFHWDQWSASDPPPEVHQGGISQTHPLKKNEPVSLLHT